LPFRSPDYTAHYGLTATPAATRVRTRSIYAFVFGFAGSGGLETGMAGPPNTEVRIVAVKKK